MLLIGLDAATDRKLFGYACGDLRRDTVHIECAGVLRISNRLDALGTEVLPRLRRAKRALIAIDAPLGWPEGMGKALMSHQAGGLIEDEPNLMFRRETDRHIKRLLGKQPLEVGANLIARTAHAALRTLDEIRVATGASIPLAWDVDFEGFAAIEVYPAATLRAWRCTFRGYREANGRSVRRKIADTVASGITPLQDYASAPLDAFDACLCLLAARDFLLGQAAPPGSSESARKEGWIWVRKPDPR